MIFCKHNCCTAPSSLTSHLDDLDHLQIDEDFSLQSSSILLSGFELLPQVDYAGIPFELQKEDTNTIWGDNADKRRKKRDTMLKSTLRGRRKGTLKVPGQVVSFGRLTFLLLV